MPPGGCRQRLTLAAEMFRGGIIDAAQFTTINDRAGVDISGLTAQLARLGERDILAAFAGSTRGRY